MVEMWRAALREVANLSGWHLQDRHESEFIQHIVNEMMEKLSSKSSSIAKNFVGIESTMAKLIPSYLGFENNVCMIGIYGMGGLGKTTLARVIYEEFRSYFEGFSFIANVREDSKIHGLPQLQQQLLADILEDRNINIRNVYEGVDMIKKRLHLKKVLLVIDDVDRLDQLEKLVGEQDWFGLGSWIIITTRDEHVLVQHEVRKRYKLEVLNNEDASKLFCLKAFKMEQPKVGYLQPSQEVLKYANGLPLALVTLGSFLVGRTIDEWKSALKSFKKTKGDIFYILKISYDGLEEMWKEIFLDIACFFRRRKKDQVIQILENCDFDAVIGISVLVERSLLTVDDGEYLGMHDLLAEMGQKIIRFESGGNLGKQSRLWLIEDLLHVLKNNLATDEIRAIVVRYEEELLNFEEFPEMFSKMSNLRLLIIKKPLIIGKLDSSKALNLGHLVIPNELRHLSWESCPLKCLASSFQPKELVQLGLPHGTFEYLWEGVMHSVKFKFEDVGMVIFCVALSDYDQFSVDGNGSITNKMMQSRKLFESIVTHPTFDQMDFLLILNKFDIFEVKIEQVPLTQCDWFDDFDPVSNRRCFSSSSKSNSNNINSIPSLGYLAFHYIAVKFKRLFASLTGRKLYVSLVKGLEPDSVDASLKYAREIMKWDEERANFSLSEYSLYSTEASSFCH